MSILLGLMIFCLGIYFLSLFFQVARLEKIMNEGVILLEKFMITKYALGKDKNKAAGKGDGEDAKDGGSPMSSGKT